MVQADGGVDRCRAPNRCEARKSCDPISPSTAADMTTTRSSRSPGRPCLPRLVYGNGQDPYMGSSGLNAGYRRFSPGIAGWMVRRSRDEVNRDQQPWLLVTGITPL